MKVLTNEFPDVLTNNIFLHITYLVEEDKGDTEKSICDYIVEKHGPIDREVVLMDGCWGRKVRITKKGAVKT